MPDYSELSYRELQEKVSALGHKSVGKKREELEEILKADSEFKSNLQEELKGDGTKGTTTPDKEPEGEKENPLPANVAIVFQGSTELRRYTLKNHGENFEDLARTYASHKGGTIVLKDFGEQTICPHCGKGFYPKG